MQQLIPTLDDNEKIAIGNELDRLFMFQDRPPLTKEKKACLVEELAAAGYPVKSILSGISALIAEDMKVIKLSALKNSIEEFFARGSSEERIACEHCGKRGTVFLRDEEKRWYAFACICANGTNTVRAAGLARWSGQGTQFHRGRSFELIQ